MSQQSHRPGATSDDGRADGPDTGRRAPAGSVFWFLWMVGMWVVFFVLLRSDRLDEVASSIRDLPWPIEVLAWFVFFPWVLGTAVWTGGWSEPTRVTLVALFAIGWTLISIPRPQGRESLPG